MAASSSTAALSNNNQWFDVFINHRGPDSKETLARSLYLRLLENGFRAFLDDMEMQPGYGVSSQLEHAIRTASVHVAIFSPKYAESNWCLHELVLMLDSKAPIIPVFYGVTPAEVKWAEGKDGKYARDLQILAEKTDKGKPRYESNTIKKWRNALSLVAGNNGFELKVDNGVEFQLELVDKVVKCLTEMLKKLKKPKLHVAKYPTGLDEKLKHFEDTVQRPQTEKAQILGIWGLGGVGKTTLAKEFFNRKRSDYKKSCFLSDVRDSAGKGCLQSLQRTLLKDLIGLDKTIDNVHEGTGLLEENIEHLKSSDASLHSKLHNKLHTNLMNGLHMPIDSVDEGKEMSIVANFLVILDDVDSVDQVHALLPVDLPSGSLILITSRDKHVLQASKVEKSSIYRLTGLDNQHSRELFCAYAFSQTYPFPGFEYLVDRFLEACNGLPLSLKVFGANLYGRDIPYWEDELGTFPTEIKEILEISYNALDKEVQQMFLDISCFFIGEDRDTTISIWVGSHWKGRRGFQILQDKCLVEVDESNLIHMHDHIRDMGRDIAEVSQPLRLSRRPTENVIGKFSVIPVRGIKMILSEYNDADADDVFGAICTSSLQILDTEGPLLSGVESPDTCWLRWIKCPCILLEPILRRVQFPNMERIWREVELSNILWLRWRNCPYSSLPTWIPVKNLRYLNVSGSVLNTLWQRAGESEAPLQLPAYLEELRVEDCVNLKSIPGLAQCTKLRKLRVSRCSELEELPSMERLESLEELWAEGCVKLKSIRGLVLLTKLRWLTIGGCSELEELPSMERLESLEVLGAEGCVKLKSIRGLALLTKLRWLDIGGCSELEELPSMERLESLETLGAEGCVKLKSIRGLALLTKLRWLNIGGCSELEELPSMERLESLETLGAEGCVKLKSIRGLALLTKLRWLNIGGCSELEELPSMEGLESLETLGAEGCVKLKSIRGLALLTKLRTLGISGCSELEELPSMERLESLETLWAEGCVKLKSIRGLALLTKLRWLDISGCSEVEELPSMERLESLEGLWAEGCVKLKSIRGLLQLTKLRKLSVGGCSELEEVEGVEYCTWLEMLDISVCPKLQCPVWE